MVTRNNKLSLKQQELALKDVFPDSKVCRVNNVMLTWEHTLTPSPLSADYKVRLKYKESFGIRFYVLTKLKLHPGKTCLPHVYSTSQQQLCLYFPDGKQWHPGKYYTRTIIPWASEWLVHYETWVGNGEWHGGGTTHG